MRYYSAIFVNGSKFCTPLLQVSSSTIFFTRNVPFRDVAKAGLKFGDEGSALCTLIVYRTHSLTDMDPEEEKDQQKALAEEFKPLLDWLKVEAKDIVRDGMFSMLSIILTVQILH